MIELIALPLAGMADRVRGGYPQGERPKWVRDAAKAIAGAVMAYQMTSDPVLIAFAALSVAMLSWRWDNGWRGKWVRAHQGKWSYPKRDPNNPTTNIRIEFGVFDLIKDAVTWALLSSVFGYAWLAYFIDYQVVALFITSYIVGTLIAMELARWIPSTDFMESEGEWARGELIELPVVGLVFYLLMGII